MNRYDIIPSNVRIFGRTLDLAGALWLGYSGSGIAFDTDALQVQAEILGVSMTGTPDQYPYLSVYVNGVPEKKIQVRRDLHRYEVLRNPERRKVRVALVKLTEARNDKIALSVLNAEGEISPVEAPPHKILFIGDSLTAGYGTLRESSPAEDPSQYEFRTEDEDVTLGYAWQTAQMLHADAQFFCWSSNGVISRFIPPETDLPVTQDLMPSLLPYVDKETEEVARIYLRSRGWKKTSGGIGLTRINPADFSPDVVVSNLGTNDASFVRGIPVREQHFKQKYLEMLRDVTAMYPAAKILVTYGMMEQSLCEANRQVALLGGYDYLALPLMNPAAEGMAAGGHPSPATHRLAAEMVSSKIREMTGWERWEEQQTVPQDAEAFFED